MGQNALLTPQFNRESVPGQPGEKVTLFPGPFTLTHGYKFMLPFLDILTQQGQPGTSRVCSTLPQLKPRQGGLQPCMAPARPEL